MKREAIAAVLLCILAALCVFNLAKLSSAADSVTAELECCAAALSAGNGSEAGERFAAAEAEWEGTEKYFSAALDSTVTERVSESFSAISNALAADSIEEARELCRQLIELIYDILDDQSPRLESIL